MEPEEPQERPEEEILTDTPPAGEPAGAGAPRAESEKPPEAALPPGPTGEQRTWAVLAHLLGAAGTLTAFGFLGWVGPLAIWIKLRHTSSYVAFHSLQALLFHALVAALLTLGRMVLIFIPVWVLWLALPATIGVAVLLSLVATLKANNGEWYQYPCVGQWALEHSQT